MEISDELISHLESLAHIELDTDEREDCRRDFEKIISYMDTLSALDTDGVEPLTNLSDTVNVLREDEPGETLGVDEALSNATETAGGCFCVPKTVELGAL